MAQGTQSYDPHHREISFISREFALSFTYLGIGQEAKTVLAPYLSLPNPPEPSWQPLIAAARFLEDPYKETLARELRRLADEISSSTSILWFWSPWPLAVCLKRFVEAGESLAELADKVETGEFGDRVEWEAIEASWERDGVTEDGLLSAATDDWKLSDIVGRRVIPLWLFGRNFHGYSRKAAAERMFERGWPIA